MMPSSPSMSAGSPSIEQPPLRSAGAARGVTCTGAAAIGWAGERRRGLLGFALEAVGGGPERGRAGGRFLLRDVRQLAGEQAAAGPGLGPVLPRAEDDVATDRVGGRAQPGRARIIEVEASAAEVAAEAGFERLAQPVGQRPAAVRRRERRDRGGRAVHPAARAAAAAGAGAALRQGGAAAGAGRFGAR